MSMAIFVDAQYLYHSCRINYNRRVNYAKMYEAFENVSDIVRAEVYAASKDVSESNSFEAALRALGWRVNMKEMKVIGEKTTHVSWNVGIAVDALAVCDEVNTVVIVSGDGDLVPLVKALRQRGTRVEIYGVEKTISMELQREADKICVIPNEWMDEFGVSEKKKE